MTGKNDKIVEKEQFSEKKIKFMQWFFFLFAFHFLLETMENS